MTICFFTWFFSCKIFADARSTEMQASHRKDQQTLFTWKEREPLNKKVLFLPLLVLMASSTFTFGQKNEVSFVVGGAVSPATTDSVATPLFCPITQPNCGNISNFTITTKVKSGVFFEGAFARRIFDGHVASAYIELPVVGIPSRDVKDSLGTNFSSIFFVPSFKVKLRPLAGISPFLSAGAGVAHFNTELPLAGSPFGSNRWAAQFGGGVDISTPIHPLAFRVEARDYLTGAPKFRSFTISQHKLQNVLIGGGIVLRF
jgi:hypothetical protein